MKQTAIALAVLVLATSCGGEKSKANEKQNNQTEKTAKKDDAVDTPVESKTNQEFEQVEFTASDGVKVIGNYYHIDPNAPIIVLCHQARYNKFEYAGIAPRLKSMGFNCLAIDQRSGGPISIYQNETMKNARLAGKPTEMLDAELDILAAIDWAFDKSGRPVILWGSSYSSTLAIYIGLGNDKVGAFVSFSPGNYWGEKKGDLTKMLPNCEKPYFITSTKYESIHVKQFMSNVKLKADQVLFVPNTEGYHGSQALWESQPEGQQYWTAITEFLRSEKISKS